MDLSSSWAFLSRFTFALNPKVSQHIDYGLQHKFAIKRTFTLFFINIIVEGVWLWRISGCYSLEVMWVTLSLGLLFEEENSFFNSKMRFNPFSSCVRVVVFSFSQLCSFYIIDWSINRPIKIDKPKLPHYDYGECLNWQKLRLNLRNN